MSEEKTTPEPKAPDDKALAPLAALFENVLASREAGILKGLESQIAVLAEPAPTPEVRAVLEDETPAPAERGNGGVVSRHQPTDGLYRGLHAREPELREVRTADLDHWGAQWIAGMTNRNHAQMKLAAAKIEGIHGRADTLEGAAGASGAISDGTGGEFIPRPVEQAVLIARDKVAKARRFASNLAMTRQTHTIPTIGAFTAGAAAEATSVAQGEGTIAQVQLTAMKWQVKAVVSREILADVAFNIVSTYSERAGMSLGAYEDAQFWRLGTGTPPAASAFVAGTAYTETTSAALGFVDVVTMYRSVPQVYRGNSAWFAAPGVLTALSLVTDAVNGRPFYQGLQDSVGTIGDDSGAEGTLLRRPIYEVDATAGTIHFGDLNAAYVIGSRQGIVARASEHFLFDTDRVMWIWEQRTDGINVDTVAMQTCLGITSASAAAA